MPLKSKNFITDEPNELVAGLSTPITHWGKVSDWENGYGKYTVAAVVLYEIFRFYSVGFPSVSMDDWRGAYATYARYVIPFLIVFFIVKGPVRIDSDLLIINSRGILYCDVPFFWKEILSFQLSLELDPAKRIHVYYLHLITIDNKHHKISLSMFNKKFNEIEHALVKNMGRNGVINLGFTQSI